MFAHARDDVVGRRVAQAQLMALRLARPSELKATTRVGRTTLYRQQQLKKEGVAGLLDEKSEPKGPSKLKADVLASPAGEAIHRASGILSRIRLRY